jgi:hypothetical protein
MIPQRWSITELNDWAQWGHIEERIRDLLRPQEVLWPSSEDELNRSFLSLQKFLPLSRRHLLPQSIIAAALSRVKTAPSWILDWIASTIDTKALGIPIPHEALCSMQWGLFPIATADDERAQLFWVLVGALEDDFVEPHFTDWWFTVADEEARQSVNVALEMLERHTGREFFYWPLLPFIDRLLIQGPSAALPFYLSGRGLRKGPLPHGILASGKTDKDGTLSAVGGLPLKAAAAWREGLTAFLYPRPPVSVGEDPHPIERLEVDSLHDAIFLWETYQAGHGDSLLHDLKVLGDPSRLAAGALLLCDAAVQWKGFESAYRTQIQALVEQRYLFQQYLDNLEREIDKPDYPVGKMQILLAPFSEAEVRRLSKANPLAAFRIAQIHLINSNRQGRVESSEAWSKLSSDLLGWATVSERGLELKAGYFNREVVQRHARYDFCPDLPETVWQMLETLKELDLLKRRHSVETVSVSLGKLYGTIAQNYGFCGLQHLHEVEGYVTLAQQAFGGGALREVMDDWRRQFCYLFYALVDAGEMKRSKEVLEAYVGLSLEQCCETDFSDMNPYQHAAVSRFVAETGEDLPQYSKWVSRFVFDAPIQHPWQLWLNNAGRFLDDIALKRAAWSRSLELSSKLGVTARPMALLPLANLWQSGLWEREMLERRTLEVMNVFKSPELSQDHFRSLLKNGRWQDVLSAVLAIRHQVFPFTYR